MTARDMKAPMDNLTVILIRTFNQKDFHGGFIKYWRVMSPGHERYQSDLSLEGLKEAGIIQ